MEIDLHIPKDSLLKKHIECFYALTHSIEDKNTTYLTFPSILTILAAIKNAQVTVEENNVQIINCQNNPIQTNLAFEFNEPALIQYKGETSEVVVLFKPLGINAFLDKELGRYAKGGFPPFEPFEDFHTSMTNILFMESNQAKFKTLEDYWLSKFKGFEHPFLSDVIDELMVENDLSMSISEIASKYKISRMTLNKHFKLHIGKTPSQFRKIVRFRRALKQHSVKAEKNQLTDIAYFLNYFDQSHMIKDFKALTGYSPKEFFSKLSTLKDGHINWLFL